VLHWTCSHCTQNAEQDPDPDPPAEHVQDQQADPRLVSGFLVIQGLSSKFIMITLIKHDVFIILFTFLYIFLKILA
jgi:hypothetical protein